MAEVGRDFVLWAWDAVESASSYQVEIEANFPGSLPIQRVTGLRFRLTTSLIGATLRIRVRAVRYVSGQRETSAWTRYLETKTKSPFPLVDGRFRRSFWRNLVFQELDCPGRSCSEGWTVPVETRWTLVLDDIPDFHIVTTGFSSSEVRLMERLIPDAVRVLTGTRFSGRITTGDVEEEPRNGRVLIRAWPGMDESLCGRAAVGAPAGDIKLNLELINISGSRGCQLRSSFLHEVGHALGFFHVASPDHLMYSTSPDDLRIFSGTEQYHAQLAYHLGPRVMYADGQTTMTEAVPGVSWAASDHPVASCPRH